MSFVVEFEPVGTRLICEEPVLLREAATRAGVPLKSVCGGKTTCGKCLVRVRGAALSPVTEAERYLLSEAEIAAGYRQACRTLASGDAFVYVPPSSQLEEQKLQVEGIESAVQVDPIVSRFRVTVPPASLADQRGDLDRLADALREQDGVNLQRADLDTLDQLAGALREGNWTVTAVVRDEELIAASGASSQPARGATWVPEPVDHAPPAVGLAVDIGTTKIACYLVDLTDGKTLAARGVMNPQIPFGEDVIARIEAAGREDKTRRQLSQIVIASIAEAAADLCASVGIAPNQILEVTLVGNTAMHHLALGLPTNQLGVIPFVPTTTRPLEVKCANLGLPAAPGAYAYFLPLIAGFVGSDHVAVLLAAAFGRDERTRLAIDLGTNTEIALQARGRLRSCSTACGPAFEGAHIKYGMRAAPGAIERVKIDRATAEIQVSTIGGKAPVGICGSGILDAVAELTQAGWLDERGRMMRAHSAIRPCPDGAGNEIVLAACQVEGRREIVLSQRDLVEVQLAKGAIRAGIDILMDDMGVHSEEIDEVIIAGGFGTFLDPRNAVRIGMFPPIPLSRFRQVGNAAGVGAKQALISRSARAEAARLAKEVNYLELTLHSHFAKRFAEGMRYAPGRPS